MGEKHKGLRQLSMKRRRRKILRDTGGVCFYCKRRLNSKTLTIDHKVPKSKGGSSKQSNVVAACGPCNVAKGDKYADHFVELQKKGPRG